VVAHFLDGSTVYMTLAQEAVDVQTKFGKLAVPGKSINSIDFGFHLDPEEAKRIDALIDALGSKDYKKRETAFTQLIGLGAKAYPVLRKVLRSPDPETAKRAQVAMEAIQGRVPARILERPDEDVVRTDKFVIVGKVINPLLTARTEYFGEVKVKPSQLLSLRWLEGGSKTEVAIDSGNHGSAANQWLETDFHVHRHDRLSITSGGQVDLWPQGPGQYMSGPEGRQGTMYTVYANSYGPKVALSGALIGKIGKDGTPFYIGSKMSETLNEEGNLYLHIVPSPWNNASRGSYSVTIARGHAE
jgi:hypothetical protein